MAFRRFRFQLLRRGISHLIEPPYADVSRYEAGGPARLIIIWGRESRAFLYDGDVAMLRKRPVAQRRISLDHYYQSRMGSGA